MGKWIGVELGAVRTDGSPVTNEDVDRLSGAFVAAAESVGLDVGGSFGIREVCRVCEVARATGEDSLCNGCRAAIIERRVHRV